MTTAEAKRRKVRQLFQQERLVRLVGAHNACGARLVQEAGFEAVWASGLEISTAHGVCDDSILPMSEMLRDAYDIDKAIDLPVVADCDSGFGGIEHTVHATREYERHGIAGICIEDQIFPKTNSLRECKQTLVDPEEFAERIAAAKSVQQSRSFLVFARVEAFIAGLGLEEALKRSRMYADAGADALVIHSRRRDESEVASFAQRWSGALPVFVIPTTYPKITVERLHQLRFAGVIYANQGLRASVAGMRRAFADLARHGTTAVIEDGIASVNEIFDLARREPWLGNGKSSRM